MELLSLKFGCDSPVTKMCVVFCSHSFDRKWILNQLKSFGDDDDALASLENISRGADDSDANARGNYNISDDEESSDSENDKQPVNLDAAAQVNYLILNPIRTLLMYLV
jgi:hypothetical protein